MTKKQQFSMLLSSFLVFKVFFLIILKGGGGFTQSNFIEMSTFFLLL